MVQTMTDDQAASPPRRQRVEDTMINFSDWLKAEAEAEEATRKLSKGEFMRPGATAVVTGRPTTNKPIDSDNLLSSAKHLLPVEIDLCGKNWVGQLVEYRQANSGNTGPIYEESSPGLSLFTCLVRIGERPSSPIGDPKAIFNRKKDAKNYAAKLAIEWLIENKHMPSDGSVSFPKPRSLPSAPSRKAASTSASPPSHRRPGLVPISKTSDDDLNVDSSSAGNIPPPVLPAQKVAALCAKLGIPLPTYVLTRHADLSAVYSGHALFVNPSAGLVGAGLNGPVGEVRNVFGKKRTREACAEKLVELLEALVEERAKDAGSRFGSGTVVNIEAESFLAEKEEAVWQRERSLLD